MNQVSYRIRPIESADDATMAKVLKQIREEFAVNEVLGAPLLLPEENKLSVIYGAPRSIYWVCEIDGQVVGGAGIAPSRASPDSIAELQRIYLSPQARRMGIGYQLTINCLDYAQLLGFRQVYVETANELRGACLLYEKIGFKKQSKPLFSSDHNFCTAWYLRDL